jgi:hypothetical protein
MIPNPKVMLIKGKLKVMRGKHINIRLTIRARTFTAKQTERFPETKFIEYYAHVGHRSKVATSLKSFVAKRVLSCLYPSEIKEKTGLRGALKVVSYVKESMNDYARKIMSETKVIKDDDMELNLTFFPDECTIEQLDSMRAAKTLLGGSK